jgi:hypothetical protein
MRELNEQEINAVEGAGIITDVATGIGATLGAAAGLPFGGVTAVASAGAGAYAGYRLGRIIEGED